MKIIKLFAFPNTYHDLIVYSPAPKLCSLHMSNFPHSCYGSWCHVARSVQANFPPSPPPTSPHSHVLLKKDSSFMLKLSPKPYLVATLGNCSQQWAFSPSRRCPSPGRKPRKASRLFRLPPPSRPWSASWPTAFLLRHRRHWGSNRKAPPHCIAPILGSNMAGYVSQFHRCCSYGQAPSFITYSRVAFFVIV